MTDEKLEKEAEEFRRNLKEQIMRDDDFERLEQFDINVEAAYIAGAEARRAEWHYPSKGEVPKEDTSEKETLYLLWFGADDSDYLSGIFSQGRFWCFDSGWFDIDEVVAWKKLVPPKFEEE